MSGSTAITGVSGTYRYVCHIIGNYFISPNQDALDCIRFGLASSMISDNLIKGFTGYAIYPDRYNTTYNKITNNRIISCGTGIKSDYGDNEITGNYLISCTTPITGSGIIKNNIGYTTENSGVATFSGDGVAKVFEIGAHGLVTTDPSKIAVKVTPASSDAIAASPCVGYVDPVDNTKIKVKFSSAPDSGADNVKIVWYAEVIS